MHGANRLASNSLLEGLVFAGRIGALLAEDAGVIRDPLPPPAAQQPLLGHQVRRKVQQVMDRNAGVLRSADSLEAAETALSDFASLGPGRQIAEDWETTNIHTLATVLTRHALLREETRGSHWREDFPDRDDAQWQVRLVSNLNPDGTLRTRTVPRFGVTYPSEG